MTDAAPSSMPVTAVLDRDGRLVSADARLLRLQAEAGGVPGGPLALPALAALGRLALRLQVPLSRAVELPFEDRDVSLWVELAPGEEGIQLSIVDWQERNAHHGLTRSTPPRSSVDWEKGPGWLWQVDAQLRFSGSGADARALGHEGPQLGDPFLTFFVLDDAGGGAQAVMPIFEALALRGVFVDQVAHLRAVPERRYRLSGTVMVDELGAFLGLRGRAAPFEVPSASAPVPAEAPEPDVSSADSLFDSRLAERLDKALREPLERIIANAGTISALQRGPLRASYANYATDIGEAGQHLLGLVDDLADLQAIERADFRPQGERVDLAELARRAAGLLQIRAEAKSVRIQPPTADEQLMARAEYRRVLQILVNLIGNAVRHSPEDSIIWVRLDEEDGRAKVIVADQGGGIDPADHERVFERFERLGNKDAEGSGLGLHISRTLARAMDGDVTLDSALGKGARFTLDLPAWPESDRPIS